MPLAPQSRPAANGCGIPRAVLLQRGPTGVTYIPPLRVDCSFALRLAVIEGIFHEEAERHFGRRVRGFGMRGSFNCRDVVTPADVPSPGRSEHAFGNAIDIAHLDLVRGERIDVERHYPYGETPEGRFLRAVLARIGDEPGLRALGPDFDDAHRDHLHLDAGAPLEQPR